MHILIGPVAALATTPLLLLLRKVILSAGKKRTFPQSLRQGSCIPAAIPEVEPAISEASPIGVNEFIAELHAKSQEAPRWQPGKDAHHSSRGSIQ